MKRRTVVLISGIEAHILSCIISINTRDSYAIIEGLKHGHVKVLGSAHVSNGKLANVIDVNGKPMISPNRASRVILQDVTARRALASLLEVAPAALKEQATPIGRTVHKYGKDWPVLKNERGTEYIEVVLPCDNPGCEGIVTGICRVNNDKVQGLIPDDKKIVNKGKEWYCTTCTHKPLIPKHEDIMKKKHHPLWPVSLSRSSSAQIEIKFSGGDIDAVLKLVTEYASKVR